MKISLEAIRLAGIQNTDQIFRFKVILSYTIMKNIPHIDFKFIWIRDA